MELDAVYVILPMFQRHDLSFGADGGNGQRFGKVLRIVFFERNTFIILSPQSFITNP